MKTHKPQDIKRLSTFHSVADIACDFFAIEKRRLMSKTRKSDVIKARQFINYYMMGLNYCYFDIKVTKSFLALCWKQNHATILNSIDTFTDLLKYETLLTLEYKDFVAKADSVLTGGLISDLLPKVNHIHPDIQKQIDDLLARKQKYEKLRTKLLVRERELRDQINRLTKII